MDHLVGHKSVHQEHYQKNAQNHQMTLRNVSNMIVAKEHVQKENCAADPHNIAQRARVNCKCDKRPQDRKLQNQTMTQKSFEFAPKAKYFIHRMLVVF